MTAIATNRSSFNPAFWGCPHCDWPLEPDQSQKDDLCMECACGRWVVLPEPPIPPPPPPERPNELKIFSR